MLKEEKEVRRIEKRILELGPIHPGSISEQYSVCGKKNCRCADPENPVKHGPYYQLSYTIRGKSSSVFIKKEELAEARNRTMKYKKFRELCADLTAAHVELAGKTGFTKG